MSGPGGGEQGVQVGVVEVGQVLPGGVAAGASKECFDGFEHGLTGQVTTAAAAEHRAGKGIGGQGLGSGLGEGLD